MVQLQDPTDSTSVDTEVIRSATVSLALNLGFDGCRIARCEQPRHSEEFRNWIENGEAGEMAWMERTAAKRTDPQLVLAGARSVIVLSMNYWQGQSADETGTKGKIARYAWGDDYHDVLLTKLKQVDRFLQTHGGKQRYYVDTGPVLERDYAAEAGIGWHGKSTMLLNRELGTWFFLAEILTTLAFEPDAPQPQYCGSCTRCMTACPTGAIPEPHRLDARRCISYLTIELKGAIPVELRPLIGNRIYGCDDCLDACPWNRFAKVARETAFAARPFVHDMELRDFLQLDDAGFNTMFRSSPIRRIKRRGFLRNVCVALGNVGGPDDMAALEIAAQDPEPLIAEHAAWALESVRKRLTE